jgi:hypothetical protein
MYINIVVVALLAKAKEILLKNIRRANYYQYVD